MSEKHVVVVGAGPGGLTAAMILARRGFRVSVFEKQDVVGGRNASIRQNGYSWDIGPTFLMMPFLLEDVFDKAGTTIDNQLAMTQLDPMYKLSFVDREIFPSSDPQKMADEIERHFPGQKAGLYRFYAREKHRFDLMYPCLKKPYSSLSSMVSRPLLKALPHLSLGKSLYGQLGEYFNADDLRVAFTFQAKYLGMSPWECPAAFTIIPWVEHAHGVFHTTGGLSAISDAMHSVALGHGATFHLGRAVNKVMVTNGIATGVELSDGERVGADFVVLNADFGHAMATLFDQGVIRKYSPKRLKKKKYSCSTFMLYLGIDKIYDEPHHNIIFAHDYKKNIQEIVGGTALSHDMSIYVRNASKLDSTLAPKGHSALYVLVPVPNMNSSVAWDESATGAFREEVLNRIIDRTSMKDLRSHITEEIVITPDDWQNKRDLFLGATFNLGHSIDQMLYFRPHNQFEEVKGVYLVGGGTHPGSGLPTIYESARISSDMIESAAV